ncbi:MAG: branched-chain amino acid ABC transporter permease [Alphaproteobacteria bacterium]|nr:MAG: branched-chain amino acid ABC transporter permease [Alphaproteobacteria bacterium]
MDHPPPQPNIGRSCSDPCSCWSCCLHAAASTACWRERAVADALLEIEELTKRFGGVIAGAICGVAGALLANHTGFISPATMHWTRSGDLIVMVVLGGMASSFGPLIGAVALLSLEEALPILIRAMAFPVFGDAAVRMAEYWQIVLGPLFLLVVLFARGGIDGLLAGARRG